MTGDRRGDGERVAQRRTRDSYKQCHVCVRDFDHLATAMRRLGAPNDIKTGPVPLVPRLFVTSGVVAMASVDVM